MASKEKQYFKRNKLITFRYLVLRKTMKQNQALDILIARYKLVDYTILRIITDTKKELKEVNAIKNKETYNG